MSYNLNKRNLLLKESIVMDNTIDYKHYLYRYVEGKMDQEEQKWFEKEIDSNPVLKAEVEMHQRVNRIINNSETLELHQKLNAIYNTLDSQQPTRNLYRLFYYTSGVAASVALGVFFFRNGQVDPQLIAEKYYHQPEHFTVLRNADSDNVNIAEALSFFNRSQYNEAVLLIAQVLEQDPEMKGLHLYLGISYYELEKYNLAVASFNEILYDGQNPFINTAEWYKGLCLLKLKKQDEAMLIFEELALADNYYSKDAKRILKKLK